MDNPSCEEWVGKESGTLLVLGSAPCLFSDLESALALRPGAKVMAVNEACGAVEHIDHMLAGHCDKADLFRDYRLKKFPGAKDVPIHASRRGGFFEPSCVTHWWRNVIVGGTSAWKAARIGVGMGFDEIIFCGCPLDLSGYFNPNETKGFRHECRRVGEPLDGGAMSQLTIRYRKEFVRNAERFGHNVRSMSGWSRDILGAP